MKILTWNCNGGFRNKLKYLNEIEADIYIIQECENTPMAQSIYHTWMPNYLWKGENINKGIAIFAKSHLTLTALDWQDQGLELFLPVKVDNIQLIAIWTKFANSPTFQYIGQLWKYLQLHHKKVQSCPTILCGDLNSNAQWDVWDRWWNHSDVVEQLEGLQIKSLYHVINDEKQGSELKPTFYMQRNLNKSYHIDYLFSSSVLYEKSVSRVNIFAPEHWLKHSDHLPILFELRKFEFNA